MIDKIRQQLQKEIDRLGNAEAVAEQRGLPVEAVRRVLAGKGLRSANFQAFSEALGLANPVPQPSDYWRGVLYACENFAEVTARLLREAREADELAQRSAGVTRRPGVADGAIAAALERETIHHRAKKKAADPRQARDAG